MLFADKEPLYSLDILLKLFPAVLLIYNVNSIILTFCSYMLVVVMCVCLKSEWDITWLNKIEK